MTDENKPVHITGTQAKGGVRVGAMRYVLGVSLVLVIVIFTVIVMRPFG